MAIYQSRGRDPLLDSETQAALEKRSKELLGFALGAVGVLIAMMIYSYSPNDPSWISATDAPVQNWLGRFGASTAAPVMMIVGKGIWVLPLVLIAWGIRFVGHFGEERALGRIIYTPMALALASLYAATLTPGADWLPNFGLGGMLGDTVLGVVLNLLAPIIGSTFAVKLLSLILCAITLFLLAFALGFTKPELKTGARFVLLGTVMLYSMVLGLVGKGAAASARVAAGAGQSIAARREDRVARKAAIANEWAEQQAAERSIPQPDVKSRAAAVVRANPVMPTSEQLAGRKMPPMTRASAPEPELVTHAPAPQPQKGLLAGLLKRNDPQPELVEEPNLDDIEAPDESRISARISDAIRNRAGGVTAPVIPPARVEPRLTAGRGPTPLVLDVRNPEAEAPMQEMVAEDEAVILEDRAETPAAKPVYQRSTLPPVPEKALVAEPLFDTEDKPTPAKVVHATPKAAPSKQAQAEAQPTLQFEERYPGYENPPLSLLMNPVEITRHHLSDESLEENARMLESVLDDYGVKGEIVAVRPGPVVTMYELEPAPGLKASRVIGLADDIARSMSALSARVSTVPGRSVIGIELPNENREKVVLREILSHRDFGDGNHKLPLALGKDIGGEPIIANLAKMPHLLIAGTTGSGKSVAINTMILSLLYKLSPEECRMIMIDPKMLELSVYDGIPHLLSPVVTDPKKAVVALKWVVGEMEERYRKMSKMGVRNIDGYNGRVKEALAKDEMFSRTVQTGFDDETGDPIFETDEFKPEVLPYIVVIVDEMADLMMVAGKEIEACIQRLAQMARASGIHLIMATQRPSVDVITGTIKANFPTRISFQVTSKIDSRTILGEMGAEQLLGMGDMLYMAGGSKITRVHGPFCSDEEVEEIVNYLKSFGPPEYMSGVVEGPASDEESSIDLVLGLGDGSDSENALYDTAVAIVIKDRKCSTSYIQRKLAIGYNKAARLVEQMEDEGVVSSANHVGKREILVPEQHH
jgi:S-DNA-T family DNA segregation ATPase FtsK/SpoIIIE